MSLLRIAGFFVLYLFELAADPNKTKVIFL